MKLEFRDASNNNLKYRCNVHTTGKLGFNADCNILMNIAQRKYFKIACDVDNGKMILYLVDSEEDPLAARVYKAGKYYYLKLASFFDDLKLDYVNNSVSFTVKKGGEYEGREMFILKEHRNVKRKEGEKEEGDDELDAAEAD